MKILFVALILFLSVGVTFSQTLLQRIGLNPDYLLIALGATAITGLLMYRGLLLILLVITVSISVNLPPELLQQYSIDRDVLIVLQMLMILFPLGMKSVGKVSFS